MTKYRLLKDLPDLKAGAVFEWSGSMGVYKDNLNTYCYRKSLVESSPEWFERVDCGMGEELVRVCQEDKSVDWEPSIRKLANHIKSPEFIERYFFIANVYDKVATNQIIGYKIVPKDSV